MFRIITLIALILFLVASNGCQNDNQNVHSAGTESPNAPLSVSLSAIGYVYEWNLDVDARGDAQVSEVLQSPKISKFKVLPIQLAELKQTVVTERFFELGDEYGDRVPNGSTINIKITQGKVCKSVSLLYLKNWEQEGNKKLPEARRAERILSLLMKWKNDASQKDKIISIAIEKAKKEGIDLRKYDLVQSDHKTAEKGREWTVFFNGKAPTKPGDHFFVRVSDDIKKRG